MRLPLILIIMAWLGETEALVAFNQAFAASQFTSMATFLAFPWDLVGQITELYGTRWPIALADDFTGLVDQVQWNNTLHYIWTMMVPLYEDVERNNTRRIQKLYVGFKNGAWYGYQAQVNYPGSAFVLHSENQTCPKEHPLKNAPYGWPEDKQTNCRFHYEPPQMDRVTGQVIGHPTWTSNYSSTWYDPRIRPWYGSALKNASGRSWTGPFVFSNGIDVGITAAQTVISADNLFLGVAAADIFVTTLESILLDATEGVRASDSKAEYTLFIVDAAENLVAASVKGQNKRIGI